MKRAALRRATIPERDGRGSRFGQAVEGGRRKAPLEGRADEGGSRDAVRRAVLEGREPVLERYLLRYSVRQAHDTRYCSSFDARPGMAGTRPTFRAPGLGWAGLHCTVVGCTLPALRCPDALLHSHYTAHGVLHPPALRCTLAIHPAILPRPGPSSNWLSWTPGSTGERIPARGASMDGPQTSSSACVAPILGWPPKITSSQPGFNVIRPGPVECVSLRRPQTRPDQGMAAGCPRGKGQQNNQK